MISREESEAEQKSNTVRKTRSSKNKTKLIKKKSENSKRQVLRKDKKGRPRKIEQHLLSQEEEDQSFNLKMFLLEFFKEIKSKENLVFGQKTRQMLIQEQKKKLIAAKIEWKTLHSWDITYEKLKIQTTLEPFKQALNKLDFIKVKNLFLDVSEIIACQCTKQIYSFLLELILCEVSGQPLVSIEQKKKEFFDQSIFLAGRFTQLKLIMADRQTVRKSFFSLFQKSRNQIKKLISGLQR